MFNKFNSVALIIKTLTVDQVGEVVWNNFMEEVRFNSC